MIIKPLTAVWFTAKSPKLLCGRNLLALLLAGIVSNAGDHVAEALFSGATGSRSLVTLWGGVVQSGGSAVVFLLAAFALDRLNVKEQLRLHRGNE